MQFKFNIVQPFLSLQQLIFWFFVVLPVLFVGRCFSTHFQPPLVLSSLGNLLHWILTIRFWRNNNSLAAKPKSERK